jgi:aryl-alcohol dehydrogenase-like predicted oxidoreductase
MLGTFVKSRRGEVTITTKFGILPPRWTPALQIALQAGRQLMRLVPATRNFMQRRAQGLVKGGEFSVKAARASLETSLRELGTDYIDFYLLHDYTVSEHSPDELAEFLTENVKAGKIRYFGLGTGIDNVLQALERQPALCRILQFENSVLRRNVDKLPQGRPDRLTITHGSLSASYRSVSAFLKAHGELARNWSARLGLDCSNDDTISALMLNYAVQANQNGLALFSSKSAFRVRKNVKAVLEPGVSPAQVTLFGQLVERDLMPSIQME